MEKTPAPGLERDLCDRVLNGVRAAAELQDNYRLPLERFLLSKCDVADGRSQEKAVEIASQVLAECFTRSPSLLERWRGEGNLEAFLRTAALNRLRSWWKSAEKRSTEVDTDSAAIANHAVRENAIHGEEQAIAIEALRAGVAKAAADCPEGLVFLRLKGLHGVDQRALSHCWGHHESQTSRRIKDAMATIRTCARDVSAARGCELDYDLLQQALQQNPGLLLGEGGTMPAADEVEILRLAATAPSTAAIRRDAVVRMCANPQALEYFAQLLNRADGSETTIAKDTGMEHLAARLHDMVARSIALLTPADARGLATPLMTDSFTDLLQAIGADGGTLWWSCPRQAALEAVFNPLEPEISGKRQPLVSGAISLALATGEAFLTTDLAADPHYSPAIDHAMGRSTRSMIAVPFVPPGGTRGVLTAVRFGSGAGFHRADVAKVHRFSAVLAELFAARITCLLVRPEEAT
ncbi:MAG: hypothetical protein KDN05_04300 [Verrucomicrobiae bacterium]|nr:hypothetical protein [Verrucomicrobiae bacterium]MCP5533194.1 hypothetical protein [Akkermansiaceae bacterium]